MKIIFVLIGTLLTVLPTWRDLRNHRGGSGNHENNVDVNNNNKGYVSSLNFNVSNI